MGGDPLSDIQTSLSKGPRTGGREAYLSRANNRERESEIERKRRWQHSAMSAQRDLKVTEVELALLMCKFSERLILAGVFVFCLSVKSICSSCVTA